MSNKSQIVGVNGEPIVKSLPTSYLNSRISALMNQSVVGGVSVNPETAMQHGTVWACSRVIEESIGQLPLKLYKNEHGTAIETTNHPLLNVLTNQPNDWMTWQDMLELIAKHLNITGNFFAWIDTRKATYQKKSYNKILQIVPIRKPSAVSIEIRNGQITYEINDDSLGLPKRVFDASEILHIKSGSVDGVVGVSPISQCARAIGVAMAAEQHGENHFTNGAAPIGFLSIPAGLSDEAYDRLKTDWNNQHQGVKNNSKTAILEDGMEFNALAINHRDSQFLETRNFQKNEICALFRVPPQMIFGDANVTYSNVAENRLGFHSDTIVPLISRIESRLNMMLPVGLTIRIDDSAIVRGDHMKQAQINDIYLKMGVLTPNEVRHDINKSPVEGADVYVVSSNNNTFGQWTDLEKIQAAQAKQPTQPSPTKPTEDK